jgi:hypothetical protein
MKNVQLSLNTAELMILGEVIVNVTRSMRKNPDDGQYYDNGDFILRADKKEMAALRSIARKLGVK